MCDRFSEKNNYGKDLKVTMNNKVFWYTGTDGRTAPFQINFVTVLMHEILHGLIFVGLYPDISDGHRFNAFLAVKTEDGKMSSIKTFEPDRKQQDKAVTSNSLYFVANGRVIAKLYAPKKFKKGSSIYHLDDKT